VFGVGLIGLRRLFAVCFDFRLLVVENIVEREDFHLFFLFLFRLDLDLVGQLQDVLVRLVADFRRQFLGERVDIRLPGIGLRDVLILLAVFGDDTADGRQNFFHRRLLFS